jgi:hypothetical protein
MSLLFLALRTRSKHESIIGSPSSTKKLITKALGVVQRDQSASCAQCWKLYATGLRI